MSKKRIELPQGALELLVLRTLARRTKHGYAIVKLIRERSEGALQIEEGSLYPALHRMERHGWIEAEWGVSDTGRRAKFYSLTDDGRAQLSRARRTWDRMTGAVRLVLGGRVAGARNMSVARTKAWLHSASAVEQSVEADIRAELQAHLELAADELMEGGATPQRALELAREHFGDLEQTVRACRKQKLGGRTMLQRLNLIATTALLVAVLFFGFRSHSLTQDVAELMATIERRVVALEGGGEPGRGRGPLTPSPVIVELGDSIELVSTYYPNDLNTIEPVANDGTVLLPEIGHIMVAGFTRSEVEALLTERYTPYYDLVALHVRVHKAR